MCTHAAVMSAGTLVAQGTLTELGRVGRTTVRVMTPDSAVARTVLASIGLELQPDVDGAVVALLSDDAMLPESIVDALVTAGVRVRGFEFTGSSLEQRFVELTGEGFDVDR